MLAGQIVLELRVNSDIFMLLVSAVTAKMRAALAQYLSFCFLDLLDQRILVF